MNPSLIVADNFERENVRRDAPLPCRFKAFEPFDHGNAVALGKILVEAGAGDRGWSFQSIEVQMVNGQAAGPIFVQEREGRRVDAIGRAQAARDAAGELGFAGAQISAQRNDPARLRAAAERFAQRHSRFRTGRNVCSHVGARA